MYIVEWKNSFTLLMSKTEICKRPDEYKLFTVRLLTKKI